MRLPTFYEQNLIPNWGNVDTMKYVYFCTIQKNVAETLRYVYIYN